MLLDTSVIVRVLSGDDKAKAERAVRFLKTKPTQFTDVSFAETVWVFVKVYGYERKRVSEVLKKFIQEPKISCNRPIIEKTLELYSAKNIKFIDCYLAAVSLATDGQILSYDLDFNKIAGLKRVEP